MGQQQLLLIVIGIFVISFTVLAGFFVLDEKIQQHTVDSLVGHNLSIATEAVFWKTKRDPFYGGNASYAGLASDGMKALFLGETTHNGRYKITHASKDSLHITAVSLNYPNVGVRTFISGYNIDSTAVSYSGTITLD